MASYAERQAQIKLRTAESLQLAVRQPTSLNRQNPLHMRPLPEIPSARLQLTEETPELVSLKVQVAQLSTDLKNSNKTRFDLARKVENLETILTEKDDDLRIAVEDRDYFKEQLGMASHHLNNLQSETNHKTIDEFFEDRWRGLLYEVKQCSVQYFESDRKANVSKKVMVEYGEVVAEPDLYVDSSRLRALLAQAMIWRSLVTHVFSKQVPERGFCWAGRYDAALRSLNRALGPVANVRSKPSGTHETNLREYHRWRASTAALLEPKVTSPEHETSIRKVVEATQHVLLPLLGRPKDEHRNGFCNSLYSIVRAAITLDAEMSKQRAVLSPFFPDTTFQREYAEYPYAEYAEIHNDPERICESRSVRLVVAPGLLKCGTSEGDMYDEKCVIVKSQVSLDRPGNGQMPSQLENRSSPEVHTSAPTIRSANSIPAHALGPPPQRTQSTRSQMGNRGGPQSGRLQKDEDVHSRAAELKSGVKRWYRFLQDPSQPPNGFVRSKLLK